MLMYLLLVVMLALPFCLYSLKQHQEEAICRMKISLLLQRGHSMVEHRGCWRSKGSATLSMAYAGAVFANACLKGLNGVPDILECSYVQSTITELPFFASKLL